MSPSTATSFPTLFTLSAALVLALLPTHTSAAAWCLGIPTPCEFFSSDETACFNAMCQWNYDSSSCTATVPRDSCLQIMDDPDYCQRVPGCDWLDTNAMTTSDIVLVSLTSTLILLTLLVLVAVSILGCRLRRHSANTSHNKPSSTVASMTLP